VHARDRDPARRFRGAGRRRPPAEDGARHGPPDLPCTAPVTAHSTCPARHPSRPTRPVCTAPVTAPARTPHGSLHGPPTALCTDPHGSLHGPPTAPCTAYHGFLPRRPSRASTPGAPVISSSLRRSNLPPRVSAGAAIMRRRLPARLPAAPARPFTAFSRLLRSGPSEERLSLPPRFAGQIFLPRVSAGAAIVRRRLRARLLHGLSRPFHGAPRCLGEEQWWGRDGVAWDRRLKPCKNLQNYDSGAPRPASREALPYVFAQK
jgi:hypothetical protein